MPEVEAGPATLSEGGRGPDLLGLRPRLLGSAFYLPMPDGLFFRSADGGFRLRGQHVQRWFERLEPHLDGGQTLGEMVASLDGERREMVVGLVRTLWERGLVKDAAADDAHGLSPEEE